MTLVDAHQQQNIADNLHVHENDEETYALILQIQYRNNIHVNKRNDTAVNRYSNNNAVQSYETIRWIMIRAGCVS